MSEKKTSLRSKHIIQTLMILGILIFINIIASFKFGRLDLTTDQRHSLKDNTIKLLKEEASFNDVVYIKIYLGGELPAEFDKLRVSVKEKLDEMRIYAGDKIEYDIIDPFEGEDEKAHQEILSQLQDKGLRPVFGRVAEKGGIKEQTIIPEALFIYKGGKEIAVPLIKLNTTNPTPEHIHSAILNLEFVVTSAIRKLISIKKPVVAFLEGHGELDHNETYLIRQSLKEHYQVKNIVIESKLRALDTVDVLIIAKPEDPFHDKEKFVIDQFIMKGGKVMWMLDPVNEYVDTLYSKGQTIGLARKLNLKDQLFRYGVNISRPNLVIDKKCSPIWSPIHRQVVWWNFFPLLDPSDPGSVIDRSHPIVNNIDPIKTEYASALELTQSPEIRKTPLLKTSGKSVMLNPPVRIDYRLSDVNNKEEKYMGVNNRPHQLIGVLLEGEFPSVYKNRLAPEFEKRIQKEAGNYKIKSKSQPTKMIVIGDGDIAKNTIRARNVQGETRPYPVPLELNEYQSAPGFGGIRYGNKDFIMNAVDYLLGDESLIAARSRKTVRKLDTTKVKKERTFWQVANLAIPAVLVILFGVAQYFIRRSKYQR